MIPIAVDLPAPLGPSRAKKSPSSTSRSMPRRASWPLRYVLRRLCRANAFMSESESDIAPHSIGASMERRSYLIKGIWDPCHLREGLPQALVGQLVGQHPH